MVASTTMAQTMPVYSDELIDEAPAGTLVANATRAGYSYYYSNGVQGGYNDGFVGEYIKGDDGCIYLKKPCASLAYESYLKLEKVDEENYVAHTAQLIWVDNSGTTPYLAFATRLVMTKLDNGQFTYQMETDKDGKVQDAIYFTYKNGVLQQKDQELVEMNGGFKMPHELIGLTNSTGGWIGYGDGCITITSSQMAATTLPEGAVTKTYSFITHVLSSKCGKNFAWGKLSQVAEVGNELYMSNPDDPKTWIKGTIDREAKTVTFLPQYVGINQDLDCHQWFLPATYNDWRDVWDDEEDYGFWCRDYKMADKYVCRYEDGCLYSDPTLKQAGIISLSEMELQNRNIMTDFIVKPYEAGQLTKPATPTVFYLEEYNGLYSSVLFSLPNVDTNDTYINPEELSYIVYLGDDTKPHEFTTEDHCIDKNMTEIPYTFADDIDFENLGAFHNIYFYNDVPYAGVQSIHRVNGQEVRSEIGWINHETPTAIVRTTQALRTNKYLKGGQVIINKDGKEYNTAGQMVK